MADHPVRKVSQSDIGYSVVDVGDVRHVFATATPLRGATFDQQANDALRTIESVIIEQGTRDSIVHQAVFLAHMADAKRCQQLMRDFYGSELPATSYIPQPPCGGKLLAIEALGVGQGRGEVQIQRISNELVIARHNGISWVHCTALHPQAECESAYEAGLGVMQRTCRLLRSVGTSFHEVVRTWFYLGGVVECDGPLRRYHEFNRARTDFFRHVHVGTYPASTGIGSTGRGVTLSAIAVVTAREDISMVPVENPRQTAACNYSASYGPQSPKFARAMVLSFGDYATIFISGTASITGSGTRHVGNAARQTEETLDNIAALIAEDNMADYHLTGLGTSLASLGLARVYIKRPEDYATVRAVCERRLKCVPTIYAIADVCRDALLVEIEGVAFSRLANVRYGDPQHSFRSFDPAPRATADCVVVRSLAVERRPAHGCPGCPGCPAGLIDQPNRDAT
jgi:enamine deaminase RidA (YjgF/YER057c/UK114 family)